MDKQYTIRMVALPVPPPPRKRSFAARAADWKYAQQAKAVQRAKEIIK